MAPLATVVLFSDCQLGPNAANLARGRAAAAKLQAIPAAAWCCLGDEVNDSTGGLTNSYWTSYAQLWGVMRSRTRPVKGSNTHVPLATWNAFYGPGPSWYSFDVQGWHFIAINYNLPCTAGSAQYTWLQADLAAHPKVPTVAMWHAPRFSAGSRHPGGSPGMGAMFTLLYQAGAELLICGHDHVYERYPRLNPSGQADLAKGVREINLPNAGQAYSNTESGTLKPEVWGTGQECGGLQLDLYADEYQWKLINSATALTDAGSQRVRYPLGAGPKTYTFTAHALNTVTGEAAEKASAFTVG